MSARPPKSNVEVRSLVEDATRDLPRTGGIMTSEEKLIRDVETVFDSIRQNRRGRQEMLTRQIRQGLDSLSKKIRDITDDTMYLTLSERSGFREDSRRLAMLLTELLKEREPWRP